MKTEKREKQVGKEAAVGKKQNSTVIINGGACANVGGPRGLMRGGARGPIRPRQGANNPSSGGRSGRLTSPSRQSRTPSTVTAGSTGVRYR